MRYIGNTLKRRMDMLEINAATLAEMTFMDECLIEISSIIKSHMRRLINLIWH